MEPWPTANYMKEGRQHGGDHDTLSVAINQAHVVQNKKLPAILSLRHLAYHVDVPYSFLRDVVGRDLDPYRSFPVKKRPTGYRVICVPANPLMRLQRWIQNFILQHNQPHASSKAYYRDCSPLSCATAHAGCSWLIKIDIRRFFESIDERKVYRVFRDCGYQALVAFELTRLTTRIPPPEHRGRSTDWQLSTASSYSITKYRTSRIGHLPQGAPTSPMLSNLVMRPFDQIVRELATEYNLTYTRYADDLTFSTHDADFSRTMASDVIVRTYRLLKAFNLTPKAAKTNVVPPGSRKVVLGLTVNDHQPRLTREWRRKLECHVHYIAKFGYVAHANKRNFSSVLGCFRHVQGLIAYACQIDPVYGKPLRAQLQQVSPPF